MERERFSPLGLIGRILLPFVLVYGTWNPRGVQADEPVRGAHVLTDARPGIEYVEVNDESNHVERFKNDWVRVYMATIAPGTKTLFHRHRENTLYVAVENGIHHNGRQKLGGTTEHGYLHCSGSGAGRSRRPSTRRFRSPSSAP
jgi:hypothetical protein